MTRVAVTAASGSVALSHGPSLALRQAGPAAATTASSDLLGAALSCDVASLCQCHGSACRVPVAVPYIHSLPGTERAQSVTVGT